MKKGKRIPIIAAKDIAKKYGYDQVIIHGRLLREGEDCSREWVTTYGVNREHCDAAAKVGSALGGLIEGRYKLVPIEESEQ